MMKHFLFSLLTILSLSIYAYDPPKENIEYPVSEKIPHTDIYFGVPVEDPYQWLENDTSKATEAWVKAQNKVTFDYLEKIPYRDSIKERYKELYDYPKLSDPYYAG